MQVGYAEIAILSLYLASLRAVKRFSGKCNTLSCNRPWRFYNTIVAGKRRSLLKAENNDEVYDKRPQRYAEDNVTHLVNLKPK